MKKYIYCSSLCLSLYLLCGCGEGEKTDFSAPVPQVKKAGEIKEASSPAFAADPEKGILYLLVYKGGNFRSGVKDQEHIFAYKSTDKGKTWKKNGSIFTPVCYGVWGSDLKFHNGDLYFIWTVQKNGGKQILFTRSSNGGMIWTPYVIINDARQSQRTNPFLHISNNGKLYVVWKDYRTRGKPEIYFSTSTDKGKTWSPSVVVDRPANIKRIFESRPGPPASAGNTVYATLPSGWSLPKKRLAGSLLTAVSKDGGKTWKHNIALPRPLVSDIHCIADGKGKLYALILGNMGIKSLSMSLNRAPETKGQVFLYTSEDDGKTWQKTGRLDDDPETRYKSKPQLILSGDTIVALWNDLREPPGVYFTTSRDAGKTWSPNKRLVERSSVGDTQFRAVLHGNTLILTAGHMVKGAGDKVVSINSELAE